MLMNQIQKWEGGMVEGFAHLDNCFPDDFLSL